jgi:LysM repeat protein
MNERPSATARALAVIAVICGFLALIVVLSVSFGDDGDDGSRQRGGGDPTRQVDKGKKRPKAYVVQNGDTLTSIARRTGVSVARIQALNPGVDPQILVSGEKLKLR